MSKTEQIALSVQERLVLAGLLPREGNLATLRLMRQFREELSLSEREVKDIGLHEEGPLLKWDTAKEKPKTIEMGPWRTEQVRKLLDTLNNQAKLTEQHLTLCEKFGIGSDK